MAVDVTGVFLELVPRRTHEDEKKQQTEKKKPSVFNQRAKEVIANANMCSQMLQRVSGKGHQQDQRGEYLTQLSQLIDQCGDLCKQLKTALDTVVARNKSKSLPQTDQYRYAVIEFLFFVVDRLKSRRDLELKREKQRLIVTSGLGSSALMLERPEFAIKNRKAASMDLLQQESEKRAANDQAAAGGLDVNELPPEEALRLEQENELMWATLNDEENEFASAVSSIHDIERLNAMLSGHLTDQQTTLDSLSHNTCMANDSVKLGNESLRSAISNRSVTRFWILFTVCILSLSLIFLDWYNP